MSVGGAVSGIGGVIAGEQQARMLEANAKVARRDAQMARDAAQARAGDIERDARRVKATQRAMAAAGGAVTTEGSPLNLMIDTAREARRDVSRTLYAGAVEAARNIFVSRIYGQQAENVRINSYISLVAQALGGSAVQNPQLIVPQQSPYAYSSIASREAGQGYLQYRNQERMDYTGYLNPAADLGPYGGNYNPPASVDAGAYDAGGMAGAF